MDLNPDPGGPKTRGSSGSGFGSATLAETRKNTKKYLNGQLPGGRDDDGLGADALTSNAVQQIVISEQQYIY